MGARALRKVEKKWRDEKPTENDEGMKSNFIGAASIIKYLYIQLTGEYAIVQQNNEAHA